MSRPLDSLTPSFHSESRITMALAKGDKGQYLMMMMVKLACLFPISRVMASCIRPILMMAVIRSAKRRPSEARAGQYQLKLAPLELEP